MISGWYLQVYVTISIHMKSTSPAPTYIVEPGLYTIYLTPFHIRGATGVDLFNAHR